MDASRYMNTMQVLTGKRRKGLGVYPSSGKNWEGRRSLMLDKG
jgi:hypothetical protein